VTPLATLEVMVVDCQSSGATPAHGDLLELGWGTVGPSGVRLEATFVRPATDRPISAQVRKLTGWSHAALAESIDPLAAWRLLLAHSAAPRPVPTVIHFARFELAFLRDLHARSEDASSPFPLDVVCLHAAATRLFPDLPRRNLRALAGLLGHAPELLRQARGHVEATAFLWNALVPRLAAVGVTTWEDLRAWLEGPPAQTEKRSGGRDFPLAAAKRRALPDAPGVYRFVRPNGDVLYVGKAASVKKRVASHFTRGARAASSRERALEMLSQVDHVDVTPAATILEAALLEVDEIKRLDPPYNRQLRAADRRAWFATTGWDESAPEPSARHRVGPLPSARSLDGIAAIRALALGAEPTKARRAAAVGVPPFFAPEAQLFDLAWRPFFASELSRSPAPLRTRILEASRRIVVRERDDDGEEEAPPTWDEDRSAATSNAPSSARGSSSAGRASSACSPTPTSSSASRPRARHACSSYAGVSSSPARTCPCWRRRPRSIRRKGRRRGASGSPASTRPGTTASACWRPSCGASACSSFASGGTSSEAEWSNLLSPHGAATVSALSATSVPATATAASAAGRAAPHAAAAAAVSATRDVKQRRHGAHGVERRLRRRRLRRARAGGPLGRSRTQPQPEPRRVPRLRRGDVLPLPVLHPRGDPLLREDRGT
jgi:DNA polymerase III epsilon subunit-like protein